MTKILLSANTDWFLYNFRSSLANYLRERGFEVVLVSPPGTYAPKFEEKGFRWIPWNLGRQTLQPWRELPSFRQLADIYRREAAELLHHHTIKPVLYGSLIARMTGIDNVVNSITGRGYVYISKEPRARFLKQITSILYRLALNNDNFASIFENDTDRRYFIDHKFTPEQRTWLISGIGVDPDHFKPEPEPAGIPTVLFSGRMLWDKGVGVLVDAARILHKQIQVRVVLTGEPDPGNPASISKEQLLEWQEQGIIEWWGWQPEMNNVYIKSHIVTLPTMYGEGVPTVLLEAASCGRATVATDMPGCSDITIHGKTGLIVPVNDPLALAEALHTLIRDENQRGRMGLAARQLVLDKFTSERVNEATLNVYNKVLQHSLSQQGEHNP
jgi:glycosyltransferase involved in cell wall biosynthesis